MWSFVRCKKEQRWLWWIEDARTGQVVAFVFGRRTHATFRQVLEEWKGENRDLAKDSLRKYDQLATMMESWQPGLRPEQVVLLPKNWTV